MSMFRRWFFNFCGFDCCWYSTAFWTLVLTFGWQSQRFGHHVDFSTAIYNILGERGGLARKSQHLHSY